MLTLWRKWIAYPIGWLVLMTVLLTGVALVSGWGGTDPAMESFDARYTARSTGDQVRMDVREKILVTLDDERGIIRDLTTTYGQSRLDITDITVQDEDGEPVRFREERGGPGDDIEIRIGDASYRVSGLQTYVIDYTIHNAMVGNDKAQALYFNTNGTEWDNGFKEFSARLEIDDDLPSHLAGSHDCYQGRAGSAGRCDLRRNGNAFSVTVPDGLDARENVTLDVGFNGATITNPLPPYRARSHGWVGLAILVGIGVLALAVALIARWIVRDLRHGESGVVTQFTPPENIDPLLAADFLGRPEKGAAAHLAWLVLNDHAILASVTTRTATLPGPGVDDLDASGRAELDEDLRLRWDRDSVPGTLRTITELLFGDEDTYLRLSQYRRTSDLLKAQHYRDAAVEDLGLRRDSNLGPWMLWLGYLTLIGYGTYQVWIGLDGLLWWFLLSGVLATVLLLLAVHLTPSQGRLTKKGRDVRRHLMGLERFVTTSEANRIAWLQNADTAPREDNRVHLYERLLPWAIIFGAERSWAQLLGTMYDRFPDLRSALPSRLELVNHAWSDQDRDFYTRRDVRTRRSTWFSRADIGTGALASGWNHVTTSLSDNVAGRGSSNSSTRSSGRGSRGGSSRRSSGGGTGGGGGRRW